jgi:hypothetical protein
MDLPCPEKFSFDAAKWPAWKQRFERFRIASDLCEKPETRQVSMLLYCMGDAAEDVFASFKLSADDAEVYDTVLKRFDEHFVITKNVIFERAQFNQRKQEPRESTEAFVTALHKLADTCDFGALRDELIRDRIVVGIQDAKISERLQLDRELTLAKAVTVIRQAEQVRQQQGLLRAPTNLQASCDVNAIKTNRQHASTENFQRREQHRQHRPVKSPEGQATCKWCGRQKHDRQQCPAREAVCRNCKKTGHYEKVCRSNKKTVRAISTESTLFLDNVSDNKRVKHVAGRGARQQQAAQVPARHWSRRHGAAGCDVQSPVP